MKQPVATVTAIAILLPATLARGAPGYTYYVDGNLEADCTGDAGSSYRVEQRDCGGSDGTKAWSRFAGANSAVSAGDTVYVRGGTFKIGDQGDATEGISPKSSGLPGTGNRIVYKRYGEESVELVGNSVYCMCVDLEDGQSYITVDGVICRNFFHHMHITDGSYNEIANSVFSGVYDPADVDWRGSTIEAPGTRPCPTPPCTAMYNWIHDCLFENYGSFEGGTEGGVVFEIGYDSDDTDGTDYNVVENNIFQHGAHHVLGVQGQRNVVRNNYIQNSPWYNLGGTFYGNRDIYLDGLPGDDQQNLLERNRIAYGGPIPAVDHISGEGGLFAERYIIARYNEFVRTPLVAWYSNVHQQGGIVDNNCIYSNTFWHAGYDTTQLHKTNVWGKEDTAAIFLQENPVDSSGGYGVVTNTHIRNNLFYQNKNELNASWDILANYDNWRTPPPPWASVHPPEDQDIVANWHGGTDGDPLFVNIDGDPDPSNPNQWDFTLQSDSGAKDIGEGLTQATNSASAESPSTVLYVKVPYYFQNGWGNGAGGGAFVQADWVAVGSVDNFAQIADIDYDAKKITLSKPLSWPSDAQVWLYRDSSGRRVLYGSAPDMGAHEFCTGTDCEASAPPHGPGSSLPSYEPNNGSGVRGAGCGFGTDEAPNAAFWAISTFAIACALRRRGACPDSSAASTSTRTARLVRLRKPT